MGKHVIPNLKWPEKATAHGSGGRRGVNVVALAGGVGGAKLADGLYRVLPPDTLTIIGNTADDLELFGLHISPDLDTVMYTLAGLANPATGWGVVDDTFTTLAHARTVRRRRLVPARRCRLRHASEAHGGPARRATTDRGDGVAHRSRSASAPACCRCATSGSGRRWRRRRAGAIFRIISCAAATKTASRAVRFAGIEAGADDAGGRGRAGNGGCDRLLPLQPARQHRPDPRGAGAAGCAASPVPP